METRTVTVYLVNGDTDVFARGNVQSTTTDTVGFTVIATTGWHYYFPWTSVLRVMIKDGEV